jgi:hypothetical protein
MLLLNLIPLIDVTFSTPTGDYTQNPLPMDCLACSTPKRISDNSKGGGVALLPSLYTIPPAALTCTLYGS